MSIRLHIDRLVLDGLPVSSDRSPLVRAAAEAELTRLLGAGGLAGGLAGGAATPFLPAVTVRLVSPVDPGVLGRQIARSVYGRIGP